MSTRTASVLTLALVAGAVLRLLWVGDMEYKTDEAYLFHRSQVAGSQGWPALGQQSGVGLRNPGLSVWIFVASARAFGIHDPTGLDRVVQVANIAALVLLVVFALRCVAPRERERWLWGTALMALSPPAILFSRKIWAQSVLPLFSVLVFMAWWARRRPWAAFLWGLGGVLLGEIHMSGFFFAAGLVLWTALFDRRSVRWTAWLAGTLVGVLTLIPWLQYVLGHSSPSHRALSNVVELTFWRLWAEHPLAIDLQTSLGREWGGFLSYPHIGGVATHGVAVSWAVIIGIGIAIAAGAARQFWPLRAEWRDVLVGRGSPTAFGLSAAFFSFGGLLTLSAVVIYRHYLLVAFVLPFLWVASLALLRPRAGRRLLAVLCIAQALLAVQFLAYIHDHRGAPRGDYGVSYDAQPVKGRR